MPSSRRLASDLGVSRNTVTYASSSSPPWDISRPRMGAVRDDRALRGRPEKQPRRQAEDPQT
ncbi:hypothetical protein QCM79_33730 [Bradyrhizobium sp. SSUT77]|nr:hypothetical protein [Bradyrhizobium sp. SSUT77]MDH2347359.1 hypothetical protein [Bradyrhizobium sp. SSUT77]